MTKRRSSKFSSARKRIGGFFSRNKGGGYTPLLSGSGLLGWVITLMILPWVIFAPWSVFQFALTNYEFVWCLPAFLIAIGIIMGLAGHRFQDAFGWVVAGIILTIAFYLPSIFDALFWGIRWAFGVN